MGLILCKTKESNKPYTIRNVGQSIHSLEELSYYIYNNVYLIVQDLIDDSLIEYIREELGEEKLANNLVTLMQRKVNLSDLIVCILRYVDYYSVEEIEQLKVIIDSMNSKNVLERITARADNLLKNDCCHSAIKNYDMIITGKKDESLSSDFYGKIYHNMGVAFARLFLYESAYDCFSKAYELNANPESLKQSYVAAWLYKNQNGKTIASLPEEDEFVISHEIETLMNNAVNEESYIKIKEALSLEKQEDTTEYHNEMSKIIEALQEEYKTLCR